MWRKISWNTWLWNCAAQIGTWTPGLLAETTHLILRFHHHFGVMQLCLTLCDPMDCGIPGFPFLQHHLEFAQTNVHSVGNVTQPSHPLLPPSLPALNLSQHQGLFQWGKGDANILALGGQNIGASAVASILPVNI